MEKFGTKSPIQISWVHYTVVATSFVSIVTIIGMCLCKKWRWWIFRRKNDQKEGVVGYHKVSETPIDADHKKAKDFRTSMKRHSQRLKTLVNSTNDNQQDHYKLSLSYTQPPVNESPTPLQSASMSSSSMCNIHIENIQPAYEDLLAYEELRAGHMTLPKHIPEAPTDLSENLGLIFFSISYDVFTQVMQVLIDRAEGLPKMDTFGTSDPYVKLSLLPNENVKLETRVKRRNLSPIWNEIFTFTDFPHEKLMEKCLCLQVFDYDRFSRDDAIGEVTLVLKDIPMQNTPVDFVKELSPSTHSSGWLGDILLSLSYKSSDSHLTVIVMKGRKLKPMDVTGKSDPYVKVTLLSCGRRIAKKRTSVKLKNVDPEWNEAMIFEIIFSKIRDIQILVTVMDYNHYLPNKTIGHVIIGPRSTGTGIKHWTDMLSSSRKAVAMWHRIVKQRKVLN